MELPIATLCDSAHDYQGKLCILGTFDSFAARSLPVVHPGCALALRFVFTPEDEGERNLTIRLIDSDGTDILPQPMQAKIGVQLPPGATFFARNLVAGLQNIQFVKEGDYALEISVDDKVLQSLPLRVLVVNQQQAAMA